MASTLLIVWEKQEGGGKDSVVMSRRKALQLAKDNDLDLVLLNGNVTPPVCQIMDYGAEQYRKKKNEKAKVKNSKKQQTKGVQLKGMIAPHDFERKVNDLIAYLERGDVVKVSLEANMRILRRNLNCLDELEAKLIEKLDPAVVNLTYSESGNRMAKREIVCTYKKVSKSARQNKLENETSNVDSATARADKSGIEAVDKPGEESDNESSGDSDLTVSDEEVATSTGTEPSGMDPMAKSGDDSAIVTSDQQSVAGDEQCTKESSNSLDGDFAEKRDMEQDASELQKAESVGQQRRREAREIGLANVAAVCARLKAEGAVAVEDELGLGSENEGKRRDDVEMGEGERDHGRGLDVFDAETEADLLHMREAGAFDGMDASAVQDYHDERRGKRRRAHKTELDAFFEGESDVFDGVKGKGKGKIRKKGGGGGQDGDDPDWSASDDDEEGGGGGRRRRKWEVMEERGFRQNSNGNGAGRGHSDFAGGGRGRERRGFNGSRRSGKDADGAAAGRLKGDRTRSGIDAGGGGVGGHQERDETVVELQADAAWFGGRKQGATVVKSVNGDRRATGFADRFEDDLSTNFHAGGNKKDIHDTGVSAWFSTTEDRGRDRKKSAADDGHNDVDEGEHDEEVEPEITSEITRNFAKTFLDGAALKKHLGDPFSHNMSDTSHVVPHPDSEVDTRGKSRRAWSSNIAARGDQLSEELSPPPPREGGSSSGSGFAQSFTSGGRESGDAFPPSKAGSGTGTTTAARSFTESTDDAGAGAAKSSIPEDDGSAPSFAERFSGVGRSHLTDVSTDGSLSFSRRFGARGDMPNELDMREARSGGRDEASSTNDRRVFGEGEVKGAGVAGSAAMEEGESRRFAALFGDRDWADERNRHQHGKGEDGAQGNARVNDSEGFASKEQECNDPNRSSQE